MGEESLQNALKLASIQIGTDDVFRARPQFLHLKMMKVFVREGNDTITAAESTCLSGFVLVKKEMDCCVSSLTRRVNEGTEKDISKRIEEHLHANDLCVDDSRISSIDSNALCFDPLRQVECEEGNGQLGVAIDRNAPKAPFPTSLEEIRKVETT